MTTVLTGEFDKVFTCVCLHHPSITVRVGATAHPVIFHSFLSVSESMHIHLLLPSNHPKVFPYMKGSVSDTLHRPFGYPTIPAPAGLSRPIDIIIPPSSGKNTLD